MSRRGRFDIEAHIQGHLVVAASARCAAARRRRRQLERRASMAMWMSSASGLKTNCPAAISFSTVVRPAIDLVGFLLGDYALLARSMRAWAMLPAMSSL